MTLTAPLVDSLLQKYWFVQVLMTNSLESVYGNDAGNHGGNHPEMGIPEFVLSSPPLAGDQLPGLHS